MSRIDDLIRELCPSGVALQKLSELGTITRGKRFVKTDMIRSGTPCIHYGELYTKYGTWATEAFSYLDPALASRLRFASHGDVIVVSAGETVEDIGKSVAWLGDEDVVIHDALYAFRSRLDPKFVAYFSQTDNFHNQIRRHISSSKVSSISTDNLGKVRIPVPPMAVQQEVVKILDGFAELEAELEAKLEAELELRSHQYAFYRQVILDRVRADAVALSSLGRWHGGITPSKSNPVYWKAGTIPWLASMDVSNTSTDAIRGRVTERALEETSLRILPAPSVAVVMRSNILRRTLPIGLIKVETTVNQDMRALVPHKDVDAEYVFQVLRADSERIRSACVRTDGSMAAVNSQSFFTWQIPLPSIEDQRSIAEQFRSFDALVNDLSSGLPAEIKARRQQYEHYRDRLLTFREAA